MLRQSINTERSFFFFLFTTHPSPIRGCHQHVLLFFSLFLSNISGVKLATFSHFTKRSDEAVPTFRGKHPISMHHHDDDDGEDVMSRRVSLGEFVFLHLVTNLLRVELYRAEMDWTTTGRS